MFCQFYRKRLTKILFFRFKIQFIANLFRNIIKTKNAPKFFRTFLILIKFHGKWNYEYYISTCGILLFPKETIYQYRMGEFCSISTWILSIHITKPGYYANLRCQTINHSPEAKLLILSYYNRNFYTLTSKLRSFHNLCSCFFIPYMQENYK